LADSFGDDDLWIDFFYCFYVRFSWLPFLYFCFEFLLKGGLNQAPIEKIQN